VMVQTASSGSALVSRDTAEPLKYDRSGGVPSPSASPAVPSTVNPLNPFFLD
jgi:hypothetical protein